MTKARFNVNETHTHIYTFYIFTVKNCESKADIPFGSVEYLNSKENAFGGVVQYTCNSGYVLKGGDEFLGCEKNGKWNSTTPRCQGNVTAKACEQK